MEVADLVGDLPGEAHLVRGDQHRHALALQLADGAQHLADQLGVEGARHLVEEHGPRPGGEGAGDRDALLLAAGEIGGPLVLAPAEPEPLEDLPRLTLRLLAVDPVGADDSQGHVVEHPEMREEVVGLEDEAEPAAHGDRVDRRVGDHLAVEEDVAVVDVGEQVDAAQQGRLARARRPDQRDRLVLVDGEVDPLQHLEIVEGLGHAADVDDRLAHRSCLRSHQSSSRAIGTVTAR